MTTLEGNKLIAEFMGGKCKYDHDPEYVTFYPIEFGDMSGGYGCHFKDLHFHSSWSWLMPVIEKIEKDARVDLYKGACKISKSDWLKDIAYVEEKKIIAAWLAVTEFILWHNKVQEDERSVATEAK